MAKLKGPLFSLGASGSLGDALVFFPWKGIACVRTHVVPTNPDTDPQKIQRGYLKSAVTFIHESQGVALHPLDGDDVIAYRALASLRPTPRTWFNELCKQHIDQLGNDLGMANYCDGSTTPAADSLVLALYVQTEGDDTVTVGKIWWGTTRSALINSMDATVVPGLVTATILLLETGTKYFWQFRPSATADYVGTRSGIYSGVPI